LKALSKFPDIRQWEPEKNLVVGFQPSSAKYDVACTFQINSTNIFTLFQCKKGKNGFILFENLGFCW